MGSFSTAHLTLCRGALVYCRTVAEKHCSDVPGPDPHPGSRPTFRNQTHIQSPDTNPGTRPTFRVRVSALSSQELNSKIVDRVRCWRVSRCCSPSGVNFFLLVFKCPSTLPYLLPCPPTTPTPAITRLLTHICVPSLISSRSGIRPPKTRPSKSSHLIPPHLKALIS